MTAQTKGHIYALKEVFELVLIASIIALISDTVWVMHDICTNGISKIYVVISSGLITATVLTTHATMKHHHNNYMRYMHDTMTQKLFKQKRINKHRRG